MFTQTTVQQVPYRELTVAIREASGTYRNTFRWLDMEPKLVAKHAAKAGLKVSLRGGDTLRFRPDVKHPHMILEAKVPSRQAQPAAAPEGDVSCVRCGGEGKLPQFQHVAHGACYRCGGTGRDPEPAYAARKNRELAELRTWHDALREGDNPLQQWLAGEWGDQRVLC